MQVELLHYTPLHVCSHAIRTCWNSHNKSDKGKNDESLIYRVGNINKHKSVLEHLFYSFDIKGISRACLQELARHRMASLSVKSTRYTLKELNKEDSFLLPLCKDTYKRAEKFIVLQGHELMDFNAIHALENLRLAVKQGIANDIAKYIIPECYKTELVWSINARSLQNFLELRTAKVALKEIRELAYNVFTALPQEHLYLFSGCLRDDFVTN